MNPVRTAINELAQVIGWLAPSLPPGTAKPYTAPVISAEKRAELDATARLQHALERRDEDRSGEMVPLGEAPVPLDLDVLDILADALELGETYSGMDRADNALADPIPYLDAMLVRLDGLSDASLVDILDRAEDLTGRAYVRLGLVMDGQLLAGMCPWCGGRTGKHPCGGAKTLRVRLMPVVNKKSGMDEEIPVVVCESTVCEPPEKDFGVEWRGRPAWPLDTEGHWLARRIEEAAVAEAKLAAKVSEVLVGLAS